MVKSPKARSIAVQMNESASVSVRKIQNGYLICESTSGPKGYKQTERFSPTKPSISLPSTKPAKR